jgi:3-oxoacyl-[acyl-carrier-protein] synthase-3
MKRRTVWAPSAHALASAERAVSWSSPRRNVRTVSTGSYLPGDPITNADLERWVGPLPDDILEGLQVKRRHWIIDPATGEHRDSNTDMAVHAVRRALELAGLGPEQIDLLVLSTASPEYLMPPMVTLVQDRLGLARCATMEIRSGCAGAVEALDVARMYLERGVYETAVVVGTEAISPLLLPIFRGHDPASIRMRDRLPLYSFGDGAGAIVLQADDDGGIGILGSSLACVGGGRKPGLQIVGAGTHAPIHVQLEGTRLVELRVDVVESARLTPHVLTEALIDVLAQSGVGAEEIDLCVIPEGNAGYLTDELRAAGLLTAEWLALESRIFENLALVGATGSAAVPLALDHAWHTGAVAPGELVMLLAIETSMWKYAGVVIRWSAARPNESAILATRTADVG